MGTDMYIVFQIYDSYKKEWFIVLNTADHQNRIDKYDLLKEENARKDNPRLWGEFGRNYASFEILANISDGEGREGIPPKGLPEDFSNIMKNLFYHSPYLHSHTYFSGEELLSIPDVEFCWVLEDIKEVIRRIKNLWSDCDHIHKKMWLIRNIGENAEIKDVGLVITRFICEKSVILSNIRAIIAFFC